MKERVIIHIEQEVRMVMRLTLMVRRSAGRRGDLSTQRPRALEKRRTQRVSAIPLEGKGG